MGTKPGAGKGLRIATGCSTLDEFTAVFRKFCTPNSIFIATRSPRESGFETRFAITLKDGKPVMRGSGSIVESHPTADNSYGRPGMVIEFIKLDTMGRILLDELNAGTGTAIAKAKASGPQNFEIPTVVQDPEKHVLASARRSDQIEAVKGEEAPARAAPDQASPAESPSDAPKRAEGSKHVLPANPFGALSASSLEAFVECTLYEETGDIDIAGVVAELSQGGPLEDPILASELLEVNPLRDPPVATESAIDTAAPDFDSAPDALDTAEARAIAAAQVAEDKRPKFIPRAPKLPGMAPSEPANALAANQAEDHSPRPSPARFAPPANLATRVESPASSAAAMPPAGPPMTPQASHLGRIPVISPVTAIGPAPAELPMVGAHGMHSAGPLDEPSMLAPSKWRSALPRSVTRNQALAFAGLCLVAGLGFGALVGDDAAPVADTAAAESSGKLTGDPRPADSEATDDSEALAQQLITADAGLVEVVEVVPEVTATLADAAPAEDEPAEMLIADDTPCIVTLDILPNSAEVTMAAVTTEASAGEMLVPCGEHEVSIVHPRYQRYTATFEVQPGEAGLLRARLARPSVYLRIESTPAKAEVTINSRRVGTTPLRHKLPAFQAARVQVSSPGYKSYSTKYYVKKAGTLKISLRKNTKKKPTKTSTTSRRSATR